jgi:predicted Fe-Mo cluster-binding NifX family protein
MYVSKGKLRIAIPTKGKGGLKDVASDVFGRANTFTLVNIENNKVKDVKAVKNPAASKTHGRGPVVVQALLDHNVNVVIGSEFGPGISAMLDKHQIRRMKVEPETPVMDVVREFAFSFLKLCID